MDTNDNVEDAIELLQELGLKEYEARCFVGLCRLSKATAKRVSEITDVPRTRVYDATRVLEAQGLVEVQHASPREFRAVPLSEAMGTLRDQYDTRIDRLEDTIAELDDIDSADGTTGQEVWTLTGTDAVEQRTNRLVREATSEIVLVLGAGSLLTDELVARLNEAGEGVERVLGATSEAQRERLQHAVPDAETFVRGLECLTGEEVGDETSVGRLMLVDRSKILVSALTPDTGEERAVLGEGFRNGLVVVARHVVTGGLSVGRAGQE